MDWGRYSIRSDKGRQSLRLFRNLVERFEPDTLVIEDTADPDSPRCKRIEGLLKRLGRAASAAQIDVHAVTRAQVEYAFLGRDLSNKDDRAILIAQLFPVLMRRLPPRRELWMSENESMAIFDAMALVLSVVGVPTEPADGPLDKYHFLLS